METRLFSKSRVSSLINYAMLVWTIMCFTGTWFIILKYGILLNGLIATVVTLFFAGIIWSIPFLGLILLSLYVAPTEGTPAYVMFKELISKGIRESMK